jgi:hypothetical protein
VKISLKQAAVFTMAISFLCHGIAKKSALALASVTGLWFHGSAYVVGPCSR